MILPCGISRTKVDPRKGRQPQSVRGERQSAGRLARGRHVGLQRPRSPGGRRCGAPNHLSLPRVSGLKARLLGRWPWTPVETGFSTRGSVENLSEGRGDTLVGHGGWSPRGRGTKARTRGAGGDPPRQTRAQSSTSSNSLTVCLGNSSFPLSFTRLYLSLEYVSLPTLYFGSTVCCLDLPECLRPEGNTLILPAALLPDLKPTWHS